MNDQERLIVIAAIAEIAKSKASSNSLGAPQETSIKNLTDEMLSAIDIVNSHASWTANKLK